MSPTDLAGHLACPHLTVLDLGLLNSGGPRPDRTDPEMEVLQRRGLEHEAAYCEELRAQGRQVVEIEAGEEDDRRVARLGAEERTVSAMREGVDVVFQATFLDERGEVCWRGHADFLVRVDRPSTLGPHSYEPEDTKLARKVKPGAVLQLCSYAEQLQRLQGVEPANVHVVLGGQRRVTSNVRKPCQRVRARLTWLAETDPRYAPVLDLPAVAE